MLRKQPHSHEWNWFPVAEISETNLLYMNIFNVIVIYFISKVTQGVLYLNNLNNNIQPFFGRGMGGGLESPFI